jgi:hypothetical protein
MPLSIACHQYDSLERSRNLPRGEINGGSAGVAIGVGVIPVFSQTYPKNVLSMTSIESQVVGPAR